MKYEILKKEAKKITMPKDMRHRILKNSQQQIMEQSTCWRSFLTGRMLRIMAAAAILMSLSVSALAASGVLKGHFQDIKNIFGAVVGTSYEQATDEITIEACFRDGNVTVLTTFLRPQEAPYREAECIAITDYQILAEDGHVIAEGPATDFFPVTDGQAVIPIPIHKLKAGNYRLLVRTFTADKKADQPMEIHGTWECTFSA